MEKQQFIIACRRFFGMQPNQTIAQFKAEIDELTDKDKADLKAMFATVGVEITN